MSRSAMFLTIALVSSVATPLVVRAASSTSPSAPVAVAATSTAIVTPAAAEVPAATCARKVRVVYQGFGPAPDTCVTPR